MHRLFVLLALSVTSVSFIGCPGPRIVGSGVVITEARDASGFDAIRIRGFGQINLVQGEEEGLVIEGEDNIVEILRTRVEGTQLIIDFEPDLQNATIIPTEPLIIDVMLIDIDTVEVEGAAEVTTESLVTDTLELSVEGAAECTLTGLDVTSVMTQVDGAAQITMAGMAMTQGVELNGIAEYDAPTLMTDTTVIEVNGIGSATVWATNVLDVTLNSIGDVSYYGSPTVMSDINGFGSVDRLGETPPGV